MSRLLRRLALAALILVAVVIPARASDALQRVRVLCGKAAALARAHGGVPEAIAAPQQLDRYRVALWSAPEAGAAQLWVVVLPRDGMPFVAPRDVHIELRSGTHSGATDRYHAYPERVSHGARFVSRVALPREGRWHARVVLDGAAGPEVVQASFTASAPASPGLAGLSLFAVPFVLVAGLWGPARLVRRQSSATRPASIPSP